jgi:S1-C subfamily serine protease
MTQSGFLSHQFTMPFLIKRLLVILGLIFCLPMLTYGEENKIPAAGSFGTGFLVSREGHLVTSLHVIRNKRRYFVGPDDHNQWKVATLVKADEKLDLALLKVEPMGREPLEIAEWASIPTGLEAYTIGFPSPKIYGLWRKITQGVMNGATKGDTGYFQFSAEAQKGNSGGPVFTPDGLVMGVILRKIAALKMAEASNDLPENVNYAIKSASLIRFLKEAGLEPSVKKTDLNTNLRPYQIYRLKSDAVLVVLALGEGETKGGITK